MTHTTQPITAYAPGSFMLLGEHAVLRGGTAVLTPTRAGITVSITQRNDHRIMIDSAYGHIESAVDTLECIPPHDYAMATLREMSPTTGLDIHIASDIPKEQGYGSSTAVVVALTKAMHALHRHEDTHVPAATTPAKDTLPVVDLFHHCKAAIESVQGPCSGGDIATSLQNACIAFDGNTHTATRLPYTPIVTALYSGVKTKTKEVIEILNTAEQSNPKRYHQLYTAIADCAKQGVEAICNNHISELADAFEAQQTCMVDLGLSTPALEKCIKTLYDDDRVLAAKISGAGMGDCAIGLVGLVPSTP